MTDRREDHVGERPALTPEEHAVLDIAIGAIAASESGLDDDVLLAIKTALKRCVAFDRISVAVATDDPRGLRVFRYAGSPGLRDAFAAGAVVPVPPNPTPQEPGVATIVDEIIADGSPLNCALSDIGVRSFVSMPLFHDSVRQGWLTLSHYTTGAPSKLALPLLRHLSAILAPAVERSRKFGRARVLSTLFDASPDGMLALDALRGVREANAAALALLGRSRDLVVGRPFEEVVGAEVANAIFGLVSMPSGSNVTVKLEREGAALWVDAGAGRIQGSSEASFHVHLRDASGRRAAEDATARRLEHLSFLRALAEMVPSERPQSLIENVLSRCIARWPIAAIGVLRVEADGARRLIASRGLPEARAVLARAADDVTRVTREVNAWVIELPLEHARRRWGVLLVMGTEESALSDNDRWLWESVASTLSGALHAADDFDRLVALERERRELVDSLPVIVARVDPGGATSFANGAVERILGVAVADVLGSPGLDGFLADPREQRASQAARECALRGERAEWEDRRYRHKDGRILTLREHVYPVLGLEGAVDSAQVIAYDVTNELESRRRLMQADRLASLGALAAGIAHEINNPVAFIALAAGQMPRLVDRALAAEGASGADARSRVSELSRELGEATSRIAEIVGELKLFTRIPDGATSTPVDINRIVQMAITLTSAELRRKARLDVSLGDVPLAPGPFSILGQAFVNLLMNASQAVSLEQAAERQQVVRVASSTRDGAIVVEVSDTGPGIDPELLPRLFDPFISPYPGNEGGGSGLGLAIAYDLVRRLGGDIRVRSSSAGTTFEVFVPLGAADAADTRSSPRLYSIERPEASSSAVRSRVLIIDDEMALAKALARQLAVRYDVDTASSAAEALTQLAHRTYDAIICDLRMPDQSGPAIHSAVRARSEAQAARFIFTTGGSYGISDDAIDEDARLTGRPVLEKPFDGQSFEALVARVVDE